MRQARSKFDRKRRSEPSSSFIISLSFNSHPSLITAVAFVCVFLVLHLKSKCLLSKTKKQSMPLLHFILILEI